MTEEIKVTVCKRLSKNNFGACRRPALTPGPSPETGEGSNTWTRAKYPDRANPVLRYIDLVSGKQKTKSAGTPDEDTAVGRAASRRPTIRGAESRPSYAGRRCC